MTETTTARDELARMFNPTAFDGEWLTPGAQERAQDEAYRQVDYFLASDWLATRDAAMKAEALREAARDMDADAYKMPASWLTERADRIESQ